ncbi:P-loop containing nucleoside triphosphate hydrolase protein, partial [Rhizoctonia solani]
MEPAIDPNTIDTLPRPLTPVQDALVKARNITGHIPYKYQLEVALALESSRDVLCVAGTGSGKSLAFVLVLFMHPEWILWIVSPLNFIEDQMALDYSDMGFAATSVNASTLTPKLLKDIKAGIYSIIISSPEAFHDSNKLRPALFSKELASRRHVIAIDEAHCVKTWGETGFRKVYERIGDMRVFMPNPEHLPICAATATCSKPVRSAIARCLHMREGYQYINLGNWRRNLRYGLHILEGGQRSYDELTQFFDPTTQSFAELPQAVIFVENYLPGYYIAYELRKHFKLEGNAALEGIAVYHSLLGDLTKRYIESLFRTGKLRILISTEALTMGANFPDIHLVLTFLATQTLEAWVQRAGRGARSPNIICLCIMIVTKSIVQAA